MGLENIKREYLAEVARSKGVKNYSDTYLYNKGKYEKKILEYIMTCDQVDKNDSSFDDIKADVRRRQVSSALVKILESNNVKLCIGNEALPRAFKVFVAKDIKGDNTNKAFIDVTEIIKFNNGRYSCSDKDIDILISYLISAMNALIFYTDSSKLVNNFDLTSSGCESFSAMVYYILDYLRIFGSSEGNKEKCYYLASNYYQVTFLNKDLESAKKLSIKLSGLSERQVQLVDILTEKVKNPYKDINEFIKAISLVFRSDKLTIDVFVEKWMWLYGYGTQFGTETYPAFSNMLMYAYVGAYLNNQKTIEKVVGSSLVTFVKTILRIGSEVTG